MTKCKKTMQQKKTENRTTGITEIEIRPATIEDKWCKFKTVLGDDANNSITPYGWVVVVSGYYNWMQLDMEGIVVRSRLYKGKLYLQLVTDKRKNYVVILKEIPEHAVTGKKKYYLNIQNLDKIRNR
jgi:hypothetical protein